MTSSDQREAREGWEQVKRDLAAETYRLYVLDEFAYPLHWGWVDTDEVDRRLRDRPGTQHVVITGRNAPEKLVELRRPGDRDDQGQASDGRRPEGPEGHRVVRRFPGWSIAAPASGQRQDHRGHRPDGRLRRAGLARVAAQGRARTTSTRATTPSPPARGAQPRRVPVRGRARWRRCSHTAAAGWTSPWSRGSWACSTGRPAGELASTAQIAKLLRAPVVLVVDASSQSRSVAALVHGFASWDPQVRIGGVILNKVASDRHESMLREALDESGVPVLGILRRVPQTRTPSRHLGRCRWRNGDATRSMPSRALAAQVRAGCDLEGLLALAHSATPLGAEAWDPVYQAHAGHHQTSPEGPGPAHRRPRIAVAGGLAFTFSYAEHTELLTAAGADIVPFDPLHDEQLPEGTSGLVIGGGFPEVYAAGAVR